MTTQPGRKAAAAAALAAVCLLAGCGEGEGALPWTRNLFGYGYPYVSAEGEVRRDTTVFDALIPVAESLRWEAIDGPSPNRPALRFKLERPYQGAGKFSVAYVALQGSFTADTGLTTDWIGPEVLPADRAAFSTEIRVRPVVKFGPHDFGANQTRGFQIRLEPGGKPTLSEISRDAGGAPPDGPSAIDAIRQSVSFKVLPPASDGDLERLEFTIADTVHDPRTYVHHWLRSAGTLSDKDGLTTIWTPPAVEKGQEGAFDAFIRLQLEKWNGGYEQASPIDFVVTLSADRKLQVRRMESITQEDQP